MHSVQLLKQLVGEVNTEKMT